MAASKNQVPRSIPQGGEIASSPHRINMEHDILVIKPSPWIYNGNEVDDWMGFDEWKSWFKSQVRLEQEPRYCEFERF
ncbi:hypothetical protein TNCV_4340261 [Trichonephila clavipes]|nr:hypothetical protein TNCV_4340261 [Trichonephila clavipes]